MDVYVDCTTGQFVGGPANANVVPAPQFVQGDTIALNIWLLQRTVTFPLTNPYIILNNGALSLKVALGPKDGSPGSTLYASQFVWTRDANSQYFIGTLALNTNAIATLIGAAANAQAWFEIEVTSAGFPTTVLQQLVTIQAEVIETGAVTVPAGATAMTAEEANATFLKRTVSGVIILQNDNTGKQIALYLGDDGAFHTEPVN
jgi:hypothetical protein